MKILGNRILVSKVEDPTPKDGFQAVQVEDSFVYKGKVEQIGTEDAKVSAGIDEGEIVLFAKYSPDTQEIDHEGRKMKVVSIDDVIAIL